MASPSADSARRWVALHRRPVAAALAFVAVLLALSTLTGPRDPSSPPGTGTGITVPEGQLAVPVRLADAGIAALLRPGDRVDVFTSDVRAGVQIVATSVTVGTSPTTSDGPWQDGGELVVLLAFPEQAAALAGASVDGSLTVALHPR